MAQLFGNNPDGAKPQARAVLALLSAYDGVEESWDAAFHRYAADVRVDRWHNGREQGYVVQLAAPDHKTQLNIAFYEHRVGDHNCALAFETAPLMNPPTLADIPAGVFESSGDTSHETGHGEVAEMANWIFDQLRAFWIAHAPARTPDLELARAAAESCGVDDCLSIQQGVQP